MSSFISLKQAEVLLTLMGGGPYAKEYRMQICVPFFFLLSTMSANHRGLFLISYIIL